MSDLQPYPAYQESGEEWFERVPRHWSVMPNRAIFAEVNERGHPDENMLSVTIARGVIQQRVLLEDTTKKDSSKLDRSAYKLVQPRDLVYNKMRAWQGAVGASHYRGIVSPAYVVIRPRPEHATRYFHHLFRTPVFAKEAERWSYGIASDMWSLRPEDFKRICCCVPPADEQAAIVRYLEHTHRHIRRFIRAKQKLITLLDEQKQGLIHCAVTRGLNSDVRLKPSGVAWLPDIPEHWDVLSLRRVTIARCDGPFGSGLTSAHYTDDGVRVVRLQNIGHAEFRGSTAAFISPAYYASLGDHSVEQGDVLVAGLGDRNHPAGRACVAPGSIAPAMVKADCFRFRLNASRVSPRYAALLLTATAATASGMLSTGATRQRMNLQSTAARAICLPPLSEQTAIVDEISRRTKRLGAASNAAQREIDLVREYRTRLTADVVTGKLDVRDAAAHLPDEIDEEQALDDSESLVEDEESGEDPSETPLEEVGDEP